MAKSILMRYTLLFTVIPRMLFTIHNKVIHSGWLLEFLATPSTAN